MIDPPPTLIISGMAYLLPRMIAVRLVCTMTSKPSAVISSTEPKDPRPKEMALLTRMSTRP